jgi:hypothetical protein
VKPRLEPVTNEIASLLASERAIPAESTEVRQRALRRAEAAFAHEAGVRRAARAGVKWRWLLAAALVVVAAVATAAVEARRHAAVRASNVGSEPTLSNRPPVAPVAIPDPPSSAVPGLEPVPSLEPAQGTSEPVHASLSPAETSAFELALLQPARVALHRGDFAAALRAVADHARRFPRGKLVEEREALRVFALIGAQRRDDAERVANSFRRNFPHSMLLARMNAALGDAP